VNSTPHSTKTWKNKILRIIVERTIAHTCADK